MPSLRASAIPVSVCIAAAVLAGCSSMGLSSQLPPGVHLAGDWKLDTARSDDLGKAIGDLRAQLAKAHRGSRSGGQQQGFGGYGGHRRRGGPGGQQGGQQTGQGGQDESSSGPDSGGQGVGVGAAPGNSPVDELMSSVPRGDYLRLTVSSGAFTVVSGDSTDEYTPGLESEISAEQGDAQQISGWKGASYVIDTRPQLGAEILQTYSLTKDGKLMMTVHLKGRGIDFTFNRVYDRTTQMAPLAPPTNS